MSRAAPARLHLILARKAPVAAVFRRGPSRQVALLQWNLDTDTVTLGQWLKGRIYARRADLSPDGRHLICFAATHRPADPFGGSWTAVSRMPYLTALHLYGWGHCWNGGGLFLTDRDYWLNGGGAGEPDLKVPCTLRRVMTPPRGLVPQMGEDAVTYFPQLLRDGWTALGETSRDGARHFLFGKPVVPGWVLEKTFIAGLAAGRWAEPYSETHRLCGPEGATLDMPDAESADARDDEVLMAERGCLCRRRVTPDGPQATRVIADLNHLRFTPATSDYIGVSRAPHPHPQPQPGLGWHPLDRDKA
jgi:hypothetical protein